MTVAHDLRYALRQLRKSPAFTFTAVALLGLGIGAITALFSIFDQLMLRSMPVSHPEQLVGLRADGPWEGWSHTSGGGESAYFSYPMYRDLSARSDVFAGLLCSSPAYIGVSGWGKPGLAYAELVSGNAFAVLGLRPALGRLLLPADTRVDGERPVAVLSFGYWQEHFGGDPAAVGRAIRLNATPFTIVGVAPPQFPGMVLGDAPQLYLPVTMEAVVLPGSDDLEHRDSRWLTLTGRLAPGMTAARAQTALQPTWRALRQAEFQRGSNHSEQFHRSFVATPLTVEDRRTGFAPLRDQLAQPLLLLLGLTALLMVMVCANVATLLLVRAAARTREMAVRYALGAGRSRIFRQLLIEGALLGGAGCALGAGAAPALTRALLRMLFPDDAGAGSFGAELSRPVLLVAIAISACVTLVFSVAPMLEFWRPDTVRALKQQAFTSAGGTARLRGGLVAAQVAISMVLLVAAALLARTLAGLRDANLGFVTAHVLTFGVDPSESGYTQARAVALEQALLARLQALPGVQAAGATNAPLLTGSSQGGNISVAGYKPGPGENMDIEEDEVTPGYFPALQIPLLAGRRIAEADTATSRKVAVVNNSFARRFFGTPAAALGRQFGSGGASHAHDLTIIGVAGDTEHENVRDAVQITAYYPLAQYERGRRVQFYIRTWQQPEATESAIRAAVRKIDPGLVTSPIESLDAQRAASFSFERMLAWLALLSGFAAAAISAIGLYGVTAFAVGQRTREFGVRLAVGATRGQIVRLIFRQVLRVAAAGIAVGLPAALLASHAARGILFGVQSADPVSLFCAPVAMALICAIAALAPARRAATVNPVQALREE
jgi:putative ABC transport system permease protein